MKEASHLTAALQLLDEQEAHGTVTRTPPKAPQPLFPPPRSTVNKTEGPREWTEHRGFQGDRDAQTSLPQTGSAGWASCMHA